MEEKKDGGNLPLVLNEIETLKRLLPIYLRWRAFNRPMSLQTLLSTPSQIIDGLLTLDWVREKVNEGKKD